MAEERTSNLGDRPDENTLKEAVRARYADIATKGAGRTGTGGEACSGTVDCCNPSAGIAALSYTMVGESYAGMAGHVQEADLGLGCGIPTRLAALSPGETVVDLGSGAGNDAFIARAAVGESGRVIGLDFTEEMVSRARAVAGGRGYRNVEFVQGDIESMPVATGTADIVISNCVLNLVPDKRRAFAEMYRIIKPGGRFCVSDIVIEGELPEAVRSSLEAYAGCVAGAMERTKYLALLREAGFSGVEVAAEHRIDPPEEVLRASFDEKTVEAYHSSGAGVVSVTVRGRKPLA